MAWVFLVFGLTSSIARAQSEGDVDYDPFAGVEQLVVTGTSGAAILQDTSVSVTSFDDEYLSALGVKDIGDLAQFTPNLEIRSPYAATNPTLFIRGVGLRDFNANSASSVAVYNDGIYMNSPAGQLAQLFDTEGVEVLRGPQGSLHGRNASAGAILVRARRPTGQLGGYLRFDYGRFNEREVEGAIEVPIIEDMLSVRASGRWRKRSGFIDNRCGDPKFATPGPPGSFQSRVNDVCYNDPSNPADLPGFPLGTVAPVPKSVGDQDNWAARVLTRFQPTGNIDFLWNIHGGKNRSDARSFQNIGIRIGAFGNTTFGVNDNNRYRDFDNDQTTATPRPVTPEQGDPFAGDYNLIGKDSVDLFGTNLLTDIEYGDWRFKSITGLEMNQRVSNVNLDGSSRVDIEPRFANRAWQVSQEVTGVWDPGGPVKLEMGATFLYEQLEVDNRFPLLSTPTFRLITRQEYQQETYYGSVYAHLTWEINEVLELEGGMRYNVEHRDLGIFASRYPQTPTVRNGVRRPKQETSFTDDAPTGEVTLNYEPIPDVSFYTKYSIGRKAPHINGLVLSSDNDADLLEPVEPETVNAVELGMKSTWADSRIRFNAASFFYSYKNLQIFQNRNSGAGIPVPTLINAKEAELYGVEADLTLRPFLGWAPTEVENLEVFLSGSWLGGEYLDFVNTRLESSGGAPVRIADDFSGNQLINAPEFSFVGYVSWPWEVERFGKITPRMDWSYKDQVFFSPDNFGYAGQKALWLLNMRLSYSTLDDQIEVAGWVRNLTDEVYRLDTINLSTFRRLILYAMGDPRTYGLSATVRF